MLTVNWDKQTDHCRGVDVTVYTYGHFFFVLIIVFFASKEQIRHFWFYHSAYVSLTTLEKQIFRIVLLNVVKTECC